MGHAPGHPQHDCPPCKIIIDGGRFAAAARWAAATMDRSDRAAVAAAIYLAEVVTANENAISSGIHRGIFSEEQIDEAHAWSELQCHRAQLIEDNVRGGTFVAASILYQWATEDREHATRLAGGEYHGGWTVNGTEGIEKKP